MENNNTIEKSEENKNSKITKYDFRLLREEVASTDLFEDKTHENVAQSIYRLIKYEKGGVTIGLEGTWGSGKSSVISILRNKLKKKGDFLFLFDAWAHEGDSLRRVFLESLISDLIEWDTDCEEKLNRLKNEINKKTKQIDEIINQSATAFGKIFAISLLLIPFGATMMSLSKNVGVFSVLFTLSPFVVLLGRFLVLAFKREKIWTTKNWSFLESEITKNITQNISEENERSSVEFEEYFNQILNIFFKEKNKAIGNKRLILVIDNLDRIDTKAALKMWSTLQTFLQQRNKFKNTTWFEKLWIIIPYDPDGLSKLWENTNNSTSKTPRSNAKSFIDKSFQLKFEVPNLVFSGWESFSNDMVEKSFVKWEKIKKREVIRILRLGIKDMTTIPTPREIKNYINQVGLYVSTWSDRINISSISYYISKRIISNLSVEEIVKQLLENKLIERNHLIQLPKSIKEDIAGLVFGVNPKKGYQLLLEKEIENILVSGNSEKLLELNSFHKKGFLAVFKYHIDKCDLTFDNALQYAKAIYNSIWKTNKNECIGFRGKLIHLLENTDNIKISFEEGNIEKFSPVKNIVKRESILKIMYEKMLLGFMEAFNSDDIKDMSIVKKLILSISSELKELNVIPNQNKFPEKIPKNFIKWAIESFENRLLWKLFSPPNSVQKLIEMNIKASNAIEKGTYEALVYSINYEISIWGDTLQKCKEYIEWKNGEYSNQSESIFKIINAITFKFPGIINLAFDIANMWQYYVLVGQHKGRVLAEAALFRAFLSINKNGKLKPNVQTHAIPELIPFATVGKDKMHSFWRQKNEENSIKVIELLKRYNLEYLVWELLKDKENILIGEIINNIIKVEDFSNLFITDNIIEKISLYLDFFKEKNGEHYVEELSMKLVKNRNFASEIINDNDINIVENSEAFYWIVYSTDNKELIDFILKQLKSIPKESWIDSFIDDSYLTSLGIEVKKKNVRLNLTNNFMDALLEFLIKVVQEEIELTEWQKNHWADLYSLMSTSHRGTFKKKITEKFIEKEINFSVNILILLGKSNQLDLIKILEKKDFLESLSEESLKNGDFDILKWIAESFYSKTFKHKFNRNIIKVIKERIVKQPDQADEEKKDILNRISKVLKIRIKKKEKL